MTKGSGHSVFFSLTNSLHHSASRDGIVVPCQQDRPHPGNQCQAHSQLQWSPPASGSPDGCREQLPGPSPSYDIATVLCPPLLPRTGATSGKGMQTPSRSFSLLLERSVGFWGQTQPRPDLHIARAPGVLTLASPATEPGQPRVAHAVPVRHLPGSEKGKEGSPCSWHVLAHSLGPLSSPATELTAAGGTQGCSCQLEWSKCDSGSISLVSAVKSHGRTTNSTHGSFPV